jgi:DNA processing protein
MTPLTDDHIAAAALAALPEIGPQRLRRLLVHFDGPRRAVDQVRRGRAAAALAPDDADRRRLAQQWRAEIDAGAVEAQLLARQARVWLEDDDDFPYTRPVPGQPCVLFGEGAVEDAFERPRVAVVGTRSATPHGLADAHELGAFLARAGVTVVSGLAVGIDAAAHEGALAAHGTVVGVVATGLDIEYPHRNASLYRKVRASGVVLSEHWYGIPPTKHRFPVRNRIIAGLADVVVVIEATVKGGARYTVDYAVDYARTVLAMPGSRRNAAAAGCNQLLQQGADPLIEPSDVLVALELAAGGRTAWKPPRGAARSCEERAVMHALGGEPATLDDLIERTRLDTAAVVTAVRALERAHALTRRRGFVWPS